ncbi:MAG: hypothetical protein L3J04_10570, partial [Robiginitomaculum sp.]|nr:hypothetical protein [Robiginitomaculum sp.]
MKLRVRNGNLTLGSVFKLIFIGWVFFGGFFAGFIIFIIVLATAFTGNMMVNGEIVQGRVEALLAILPMLLLFPLIVAFHALFFAGFVSFGLWLYRLKRPLR